jgi:hypothetical protein
MEQRIDMVSDYTGRKEFYFRIRRLTNTLIAYSTDCSSSETKAGTVGLPGAGAFVRTVSVGSLVASFPFKRLSKAIDVVEVVLRGAIAVCIVLTPHSASSACVHQQS